MSRRPSVRPPHCPYCGKPSEPALGSRVYPNRPDLADERLWVCWPCDARVGTHPDGKPLGRLANADLRRARSEAHKAFDPLWRDDAMERSVAYAWLECELGAGSRVHIGNADEETCARIVEVCERRKL